MNSSDSELLFKDSINEINHIILPSSKSISIYAMALNGSFIKIHNEEFPTDVFEEILDP